VRQRQLECVLQILQNNAEQLSEGWPLVLGIIGDVTNGQGYVIRMSGCQCSGKSILLSFFS